MVRIDVPLCYSVETLPDIAKKGFLSYPPNQVNVVIDENVDFGQCGADERQIWFQFLLSLLKQVFKLIEPPCSHL